MNYKLKDYLRMIPKEKYLEIFSYICVILGIVLLIISVCIPFPSYLITASIGGVFLLLFFLYHLIKFIKSKKKVTHKITLKKAKVTKCENDATKVIAICPYCQRKIRLPHKKGHHQVNCPSCHTTFKVNIK
jgi:predicted membrane protein